MSADHLPKQFLSSLRILFDILDENHTGLIRLQDIESRWKDDGVRGLPFGVVDGLRKVTPPDGLLSFDRFVSGLKVALKRKENNINIEDTSDSSRRKPLVSKENRFFPQSTSVHHSKAHSHDYNNRPPSQNDMLTSIYKDQSGNGPSFQSRNATDHNKLQQQQQHHQSQYPGPTSDTKSRHVQQQFYHEHQNEWPNAIPSPIGPAPRNSTLSYPSKGESNQPRGNAVNVGRDHYHHSNQATNSHHHHGNRSNHAPLRRAPSGPLSGQVDVPPDIPPRSERIPRVSLQASRMRKSQSGPDLSSALQSSPPAVPPRQASSRNIIADLKNWQSRQMGGESGERRRGGSTSPTRSPNYDNAIYANLEDFNKKGPSQHQLQHDPRQSQPPQQQLGGQQRATVRRHGSGRRHTLSNGIDQNMLKRMKQLEEETTILQAGLATLDAARDWYKRQLAAVADKQAMLGKVSYNDNSVEAYQERMNFQRARITEVNQHLKTLIESSEKGFPLHMNLAMPTGLQRTAASGSNYQDTNTTQIQNLQEQNRHLMMEANQRRDLVGQLEREKAALVRDLFEARAQNKPSHDDTTFM